MRMWHYAMTCLRRTLSTLVFKTFSTYVNFSFIYIYISRHVSNVYMCILSNKILIYVGNVQVHHCIQAGNRAEQDKDPTGDEDLRG